MNKTLVSNNYSNVKFSSRSDAIRELVESVLLQTDIHPAAVVQVPYGQVKETAFLIIGHVLQCLIVSYDFLHRIWQPVRFSEYSWIIGVCLFSAFLQPNMTMPY